MQSFMDLFECKRCLSFKASDNCNYGYCEKLKDWVYEGNEWCEADGKIDPNLWFMQDDKLRHYLELENKYKMNILPKHLNRKYYKEKLGIK